MILTLDGRRLEPELAPTDTLQTVLDRVRADTDVDRLITSVTIDGQRLNATTLNAALGQPLSAAQQVDLQSADRVALVREVLGEVAAQFGESGTRCEPIAAALSAGDMAAGLRSVGELVGTWQTCYRGIADCGNLLNRDLGAFEHDGQSVEAALTDLATKLNTLREALQARDMVLIADLVRYELAPLAEQWQALCTGLARQLEAPSPMN